MKRQHDLHELSGAELLERLDHTIDVDGLVGAHVRDPASAGVLLVGSLPAGAGTVFSDVDLLVLVANSAELRADVDLRVRKDTVIEATEFIDGIEVGIQLVARSAMTRPVRAFLDVAPLLYKPADLRALPWLEEPDIRLLARLRNGVVLRRPDVVGRWRDELYSTLLPMYLAVLHTYLGDQHLERALAAAASTPRAKLGCRIAADHFLLAALAVAGVTEPNLPVAATLAQRMAPEHGAVQLAVEIVLDGAPVSSDVVRLRTAVHERMVADELFDRALAFLAGHKQLSIGVPPP